MTTTKTSSRDFVTASCIGALAAVVLFATPGCVPEMIVPSEVIATSDPVYYEGHATYWYGGQWVYRDGRGGWAHYASEPRFLVERRARAPAARRYYGGPGYRDHGYRR